MSFAKPEDHLGLVKSIASRLSAKLPASVGLDDLIHAGIEGLMDATRKYRQDTGVPFAAYATPRIRGAMQDYLRKLDWPSRTVRKKIRSVEEACNRLEQQTGRAPSEMELADFLDVSPQEVRQDLAHATTSRLISLDGLYENQDDVNEYIPEPEDRNNAADNFERAELLHYLCNALRDLPQREYDVLALYYHEFLVLREIAEVLQVSEAAISLRHSTAIDRLRKALWMNYKVDELKYDLV